MNIINPEILRFRKKFFEAVYERQLNHCISERQSFFDLYQKYTNISVNTGFYGTSSQAYLQYKKFKREASKILKSKQIKPKFWK